MIASPSVLSASLSFKTSKSASKSVTVVIPVGSFTWSKDYRSLLAQQRNFLFQFRQTGGAEFLIQRHDLL